MFQLRDAGDVCSSVFIAGLLLWIGGRVVAFRPAFERWGWGTGLIAFLGFGSFLVVTERPGVPSDLVGICLRSILFSAVAIASCWILLPIAAVSYQLTIGAFLRQLGRWNLNLRCRLAHRREEKVRERRRRASEEEWKRRAPDRERAAEDAESRRQQEAVAKQRREDARARVELAYNLLAPEIGQRFPRELFSDFCKRYLGDDRQPDDVERRSQELLEMIQGHAGKVTRTSEKKTFSQVMQEFETQQREIEASNLDTRMKQTLILSLREKMLDQLTRQAAEGA